jgi:hypothetical protein
VWNKGGAALLIAGLVVVPVAPFALDEPAPAHPMHVSYGRMVLEGDMALLNVRIFIDDLEDALSRFHDVPGLRMRPDPVIDSLFTDYFNEMFTFAIGDSIVPGVIVESGESDDMWWYIVLFQGWEPINEISFRTELLYEIFDDQRNIMRILHTATDEYQMYYSVVGAPETHVFSANG